MMTSRNRVFLPLLVLAIFAALVLSGAAFSQTKEIKERSQVPDKFKWDLTAMYKSDEAWEADAAALEKMLPALKSYEGKIGKSPENLLAFFKAYEEASKKLDNAYAYADMSYDQDTRNQKYSGYMERIQNIASLFGEAVAWVSPELVSVPDEQYERWYKQKPELAVYKHHIDNELRTRKHTLSPAEERILAMSSTIARCPANASTALRNSDLKFPVIKDENGNDVQLSEARMAMMLESPDKNVRRNTSISMLETYGQFKNTGAALMSGNIAGDVFYARARNYNSALNAALDGDNVDTTVYLSLIAAVKKNAPTLQRYCDLRRRALQLDSIHLYDMLTPLIPETRVQIPYDQAVATITTAMAPLGKEYLDAMTSGFNSHWVDVYENKGKRSGMYSSSSYLSHPYLFLNYTDTMDDMFGLIHEMGHAMHTWHSHKYQPYVYADYSYFTAEVASTFNEALLMDYLLKKEKDPQKKLALINQYIDNIRGTVITQVLFADFEERMHRAAEAGEPLTAENLGQMYLETMRDYYGNAVTLDDQYAYTWIRIPHFYRDFYVYKYATSFCASQALSQKVLKKEKGARDRYINFLSSGSSDYPIELLKKAGVDMNTPAPVDATMQKFAELVNELEKLLKETKRL